jgi:hypothetical protein
MEQSGMDACPEDFDMIECESGHLLCKEHILDEDKYQKYIENEDNEDDEDYEYGILPEEFCPLCQFKEIDINDVYEFLLKENNTTVKEVKENIKSKFSSYKDFQKYLERENYDGN